MSQTIEKPKLDEKESKWIESMIGAIAEIDQAIDIEELKRKMLKEARDYIDSKVGTIAVFQDMSVEVEVGKFIKQKFEMPLIGEDPNEEFDTGHDTSSMTGMDGKDFALLMNAQSIISGQVEKLRAATKPYPNKPNSKVPLFTDKEISEAIWAPLMRRKIIPENAIPDRYSEVASAFSGASDAYETRLVAYTDGLSKFDKAIQSMGVAKDFLETASAVANAVVLEVAAIDPSFATKTYEAVTIIAGIQAGGTSGLNIAQTILKTDLDKDKLLSKATVEAICKELASSVPKLINAGMSGGSYDQAYLGKAIAYGITPLFNGPSVYYKLKEGNYSGLLEDIAVMVEGACSAYTYTLKGEGGSDKGPGGAGVIQWNDVGAAIAGAIRVIKVGVETGSKDGGLTEQDALKILESIAKNTIYAASAYQFDVNKSNMEGEGAKKDYAKEQGVTEDSVTSKEESGFKKESNTEVQPSDSENLMYAYGVLDIWAQKYRDEGAKSTGFEAADKLMKQINAQGSKALEGLSKDDPMVKNLKKFAEAVDKQQAELVKATEATFGKEMEDDNADFRDLLSRSESGDEAEQKDSSGKVIKEDEADKIERLVMQLRKDQMIYELCTQLITLPAQAVAAFFPQAGAAMAAIDLMKNIYKACEHFTAYAEWQEHTQNAKNAMSIQAEAMTNRMNLSMSQGVEDVIQGLENGARVVAGAFACAGPFAPAGHAAAATISAISSIRKLCKKYYTEKKLNDSWALYKSALDNPEDRKTIRKAIRTNPTLSKYVIAWGAEVDGSPVAKAAMQKCGLTESVMENPNTNVSKVVSFLETLYPEDPVLLRPVDRPADWHPGAVEFSSTSIATFAGAAETDAKPKLAAGAGNPLAAAMARFERLVETYKAAQKTWVEAAEANGAKAQDDPGIELAVAEQKALVALGGAVDAASQSIAQIVASLKTGTLAGEDRKPHADFNAYLKMLLPVAREFAKKFKVEAERINFQINSLDDEEDDS